MVKHKKENDEKEKGPTLEHWEGNPEKERKEEEARIKEVNRRIMEADIIDALGYLPERKVHVCYANENMGTDDSNDVDPEGGGK